MEMTGLAFAQEITEAAIRFKLLKNGDTIRARAGPALSLEPEVESPSSNSTACTGKCLS